eukprot:CAMPEP_0113532844 /NCGR_PEP_ID=MMETSP0015_2-20120614/4281_1 /TAXON_ID=2838 /ORGANISM="Odontella" /LENGTH=167 /DNA_ID=CAMNT_0000431843 /DNA_START=258 /DNA_END=761 /DNA_ORIENTATION=+ /assembly_acc=CAM_ASM_000160
MATRQHSRQNRTRATAAGVAAGALGLLAAGPIFALIAGSGTAYYAAKKDDGVASDVARAVGDVALTTRDKARDINRKHQVVRRTKDASKGALMKAKDMNARLRISERANATVLSVYEGAIRYNRDHRVLEKASYAVKRMFRFAWKNILNAESEKSPSITGHYQTAVY